MMSVALWHFRNIFTDPKYLFVMTQFPSFASVQSVNGMQGLSRADHRTLRSAVIEQVLGTDMKKHFNILSRFQVSVNTQLCLVCWQLDLSDWNGIVYHELCADSAALSCCAVGNKQQRKLQVMLLACLRVQGKV